MKKIKIVIFGIFFYLKCKDGSISISDLFAGRKTVDTIHQKVYIPWTHIETAGMPYEKIRYKTIYENITDTVKIAQADSLLNKIDTLNKQAQEMGVDRIASLDTNIIIHVDSTIKVDIPMSVHIQYYTLSGKWVNDFKFKAFTFDSYNTNNYIPVEKKSYSTYLWSAGSFVAGVLATVYIMKK